MKFSAKRNLRGRPKDTNKRHDILEAAQYLFIERGFHGTSMDALAKRANVSKATLYSHFEDKNALYQALIQGKMADYQLDDFAQCMTGDLQSDLLYIAHHLLDLVYSVDALDMMRMVISEQREGSSVPQLFVDTGPRRVIAQIGAYLQQQNLTQEPAEDAELFSSLVIGHTQMIFALTAVIKPLNMKQREARAERGVAQFMALKNRAATL